MALIEDMRSLTLITRWSEEDEQFVATAVEYPRLSWLSSCPEAAMSGLLMVIENDDTPPPLAPADGDPLTVGQVAAKLLALPNQGDRLEIWADAVYGPRTVLEVESPVSFGTATMEPAQGVTLARLI